MHVQMSPEGAFTKSSLETTRHKKPAAEILAAGDLSRVKGSRKNKFTF